ncbi:MAG: hypothetical protein HOE30_26705 [Deltaproteobacteria bacterium]|nr:hypothetical protein [Deltaproteobacteria bacterium]MBT4265075.1 hypothetical protein [Deltaproteobacteria bacterium]MBT4639625.1 hypothetical protein [Deltaproteobacteria bacterium]
MIGQADMTSNGLQISQTGFDQPYYMTSNGNQLFVADSNNFRIMIWNSIPAVNNAPADIVLGQDDFVTATNTGPTVNRFTYPAGIFVYNDQLFVADEWRYLIFD